MTSSSAVGQPDPMTNHTVATMDSPAQSSGKTTPMTNPITRDDSAPMADSANPPNMSPNNMDVDMRFQMPESPPGHDETTDRSVLNIVPSSVSGSLDAIDSHNEPGQIIEHPLQPPTVSATNDNPNIDDGGGHCDGTTAT